MKLQNIFEFRATLDMILARAPSFGDERTLSSEEWQVIVDHLRAAQVYAKQMTDYTSRIEAEGKL